MDQQAKDLGQTGGLRISAISALTQGWSSTLTFYVNGTRIQLDGNSIDPRATLLDWLRAQPGLTGTKLGCGEGGCGACTVAVQTRVNGQIIHKAVNACLSPLALADGMHIITVEGIGNARNPHPIQERMAALHGSQCGFCTPGFIMSFYVMLRNAAYQGKRLQPEDIEASGDLDGNLCRCTGYKPILDAAKTFVADYQGGTSNPSYPAAVEHITPPGCASAKKGCGRSDCCQLNGDIKESGIKVPKHSFDFKPYKPGTELIFPPALATHERQALAFGNSERIWLKPATLDQLLQIKKALPAAKLVGGSTEVQIEMKFKAAPYNVCVYVGGIEELAFYQTPTPKRPVLEIGGNTPLSTVEALCKDLHNIIDYKADILEAIHHQLRYFAGRQIRNVASVSGNLVTASPISDLNPVLMACQARIIAASADRPDEVLPVEEFFLAYRKTALPADAVIKSVEIPVARPLEGQRLFIRSYKQAKRKDDDIAIVTCAFRVLLDRESNVLDASLCYGGMAPMTVKAKTASNNLKGKPFGDKNTLDAALEDLANDFNLPFGVPGGMASYRRTLTLSFFFRFWHTVQKELGSILEDLSEEAAGDITTDIKRGLSGGSRDNSDPYAQASVGKQTEHDSGVVHATGEARYLDDITPLRDEKWGAPVISDRPHAKVLSVDPSAALKMPGVFAFVDHNDIQGVNSWGLSFGREEAFVTDTVTSEGQYLGVIVADTKHQAQAAALAVSIQYENLPAILTIEEAIEGNSFFSMDRVIQCGEPIDEALAKSKHVLEGTVRLGGQEHFYLETQGSLVIPREGEYEIFSSCQNMRELQEHVAEILHVPINRVTARAKRLGGGFGGKETRSIHLGMILAVAAQKTGRPIRCAMDRDMDIVTSGQRHPALLKYKVGVDDQGKLQALKADIYINGGYSLDISGGVLERAMSHCDGVYKCPNTFVRGRICKTNTVSNTAFRGFGGPQGLAVAEGYMSHIAHELRIPIDELRHKNLYSEGDDVHYRQTLTHYYVPDIIEDIKRKSGYEARRVAVDEFNAKHRYRKRGLCLLPTKFGVSFGIKYLNQGHALVHILAGDGSVLVAHGGTEMGQGLYTKMQQVAAQELGIPLDQVHNSETSTVAVVNASATAASTGSDLNGMAVKDACEQLNKRLEPYRKKLPHAPFAEVVKAAYLDRVPLSATGFYKTPDLGYPWQNYGDAPVAEKPKRLYHYWTQGCAVSEIELDCLTGHWTILRTDLCMDVGRSLNPAVDYGQILGAFTQGFGLFTFEESLWLQNGRIFTKGPGAYKIPAAADVPQEMNLWLHNPASRFEGLNTIHSSRGVGEPPLFLGQSVALAIRDALASARRDNGNHEYQPFEFPLTCERIRMAVGDPLAVKSTVQPKPGEKAFFVNI